MDDGSRVAFQNPSWFPEEKKTEPGGGGDFFRVNVHDLEESAEFCFLTLKNVGSKSV